MTHVKICGIKSEEALDAALEAGAGYIGLVLFPKSPRAVDTRTAAGLAQRARERSGGRTKVVVLLVDPDDALVESVLREVRPDVVQLHGHESAERVGEIARRADCILWKAVPVASESEVEAAGAYLVTGKAFMILFDAKPPAVSGALPGGNGLTFDWRILAGAARGYGLAGGLTADNVADAVRLLHPHLVDVSSGVEDAPGHKSPELIRRFIQAVKEAKG
jgi:phosphoribosylanthranilate isomerase